MKRSTKIRSLALLGAIFLPLSLSFTGCRKPITSAENPDLRCDHIYDSAKSSSSSFWKFAYKEIPTVTYKEVLSGEYDNSYVCLDGVLLSYFIEIDIAFQNNDGTYSDESFLTDDTLGKERLSSDNGDIKSGDSVKICVYIEDGSPYYHLEAIKPIDQSFDLDVTSYMKERRERLRKEAAEDALVTPTSTPIPESTPASAPEPTTELQQPSSSKPVPVSLEHGELLEANPNGGVNGNTLVIKAKATPNITNRMTIESNYYDVIDFIQNHTDTTQYDAIDFWAVADMTDGSESKVISFTVGKDLIASVANKTVASADTFEEYLTDLWILPSLLR